MAAPRSGRLLAAALLALAVGGAGARAQLAAESVGEVLTLPEPFGAHWLFVTDPVLERASLVDLDSGRLLGMVSTGYAIPEAVFGAARREIYVPETYYSRRSRGERSDVLSVYTVGSLAPAGEVVIPAKRALNALPFGNVALSDDQRFVAVSNMTPATSLSIVDVAERRFVGEVATPGCSLVYAAGPRRFFSICMDGSLLVVSLDPAGREAGKKRTPPFFDPLEDPVTEKAVRRGDEWIFVSFEGRVHPIDVGGAEIRFGEPWALSDETAEVRWRIGGLQHLAVHEASGRLYSLMHEGGPDGHKDPGTEVWVYDLAKRERVQRIALRSPGLTIMGQATEFGQDWIWPFNRLYDAFVGGVPEAAVASIQVTRDDAPLLATSNRAGGALGIYDARSGEFRGRLLSGNLVAHALLAPFGGPEWKP